MKHIIVNLNPKIENDKLKNILATYTKNMIDDFKPMYLKYKMRGFNLIETREHQLYFQNLIRRLFQQDVQISFDILARLHVSYDIPIYFDNLTSGIVSEKASEIYFDILSRELLKHDEEINFDNLLRLINENSMNIYFNNFTSGLLRKFSTSVYFNIFSRLLPVAPSNLSATALSANQIKLTWTDNSDNETGFKIERKEGASGIWGQIATVGANATQYTDSGLNRLTTYYYRITAYNDVGNSGYSNEASVTTPDSIPNAPSSLSAVALSASEIKLTWTDNSDNETGFKIEQRLGTYGDWQQIDTVGANITEYTNNGLNYNTTYYYRVRAYNSIGDSNYSNITSATTPNVIPNAPSSLSAVALSASEVKLTWTDNSDNETGFKIERKTGINGTWEVIAVVNANATQYIDSGLTPETIYYYRVRAYNNVGDSDYSNEVNPIIIEISSRVSLGDYRASVIVGSGKLYTWSGSSTFPTWVNEFGGERIIAVSVGFFHSAAITESGKLYTWGSSWAGQLGDGTTVSKTIPTLIDSFNGEKVIAVSLGHSHSSAITESGKLYTWGLNSSGQLGDGTTTQRNIPTFINRFNGEKVIAVSLGSAHSSAVTESGKLYTWGTNSWGQLGDGTTTQRNIPTLIDNFGGEKVIAVSLGQSHSSAITESGKLYTWGQNDSGQVGDGTTGDKSVPTLIDRFNGEKVIAVSLGSHDSAAITESGKLYTWGINGVGQLGDGTTTKKTVPTWINRFGGEKVIAASLGVTTVATYDTFSAAITESGKLYTWGRGYGTVPTYIMNINDL